MSKRILVVEDQPDNRQIIRDMLAPAEPEWNVKAWLTGTQHVESHVSRDDQPEKSDQPLVDDKTNPRCRSCSASLEVSESQTHASLANHSCVALQCGQ
jgi:CheY-like chemotaxis protein